MCLRLTRVCVALIALSISTRLLSATAGDKAQPAVDTTFQQALADAVKLQDETASAVASGKEKADAAILRLKGLDSPSGLKMADRGGDFGLAAIAVGQRLRGLGKKDDALKFFAEAEKALALVIDKTPDTAAQEKAMLLQSLAFIRGYFLGEAAHAKKDFDAAILLQPKDEWLKRSRDGFLNEHSELAAGETNQTAK